MRRWVIAGVLGAYGLAVEVPAQQAQVTLQVDFTQATTKSHAVAISAESPVVVWLSAVDRAVPPARATQTYRMVQKNKQFLPHILVVPVGSTIEFPNEDPFFHNVFSLFNGKRFDLGLYQTHGSRSARFDREGVSYIFCNIHPEMGGIIVSLSSPYYGTSATGRLTLQGVPVGSYVLHVWSEKATAESVRGAERRIMVKEGANDLGEIRLQAVPAQSRDHKNMFGEDYGQP